MTYNKRIGKYEIGRTLGEGTFGKVKASKNVETGEMMAIKVSTFLNLKFSTVLYLASNEIIVLPFLRSILGLKRCRLRPLF